MYKFNSNKNFFIFKQAPWGPKGTINIDTLDMYFRRFDDGSVELKHFALKCILKIKGLLCATEICTLCVLENTSE
jgi:hypothetical protein